MRINRYIAASGHCSRRQADRLLAAGKVLLNGEIAPLGVDIKKGDVVTIDGKKIEPVTKDELIYMAFNKPINVTTTTDPRRRDNIIDYIGYPKRIFPVGRLDRDSDGLILLTNDGDIVNRILRVQNGHEKEYAVTVDKAHTPEALKEMEEGVILDGVKTLPCKITPTGTHTYRIILKQGLNRQIRKMAKSVGLTVVALTRIRIMHINLGNLKSGRYRMLTKKEVRDLMDLLTDSVN
ncbi:MAG TPA: pseudouridine synthase [Fastidiosipila sp.]|nr:pseudouridine synthase [Fastidiosipila sp.]